MFYGVVVRFSDYEIVPFEVSVVVFEEVVPFVGTTEEVTDWFLVPPVPPLVPSVPVTAVTVPEAEVGWPSLTSDGLPVLLPSFPSDGLPSEPLSFTGVSFFFECDECLLL